MQTNDIIPLGAEAVYEGRCVQVIRYNPDNNLYLVAEQNGTEYYAFDFELSAIYW
jgi:hypothetical protein